MWSRSPGGQTEGPAKRRGRRRKQSATICTPGMTIYRDSTEPQSSGRPSDKAPAWVRLSAGGALVRRVSSPPASHRVTLPSGGDIPGRYITIAHTPPGLIRAPLH